MKRIPAPVFVLSLVVGMAALPAVIAALAVAPWSGRHPHLTAFAVAAVLGGLFGLFWPAWSWRWGIATSVSLWFYFGFVFVSLWATRQLEWVPAADTLVTLLAACGGAYVGSLVSPQSRRPGRESGARSPC
ncbi:MAG: hypothetical protein ACREK5_06320 [Gemmatimonadota bacterium]